jgi:hypothetical protein
MQPEARTVQLADTAVTCPCHASAFFNGKDEENAVLLPFMAEGIAAGDTCVIICDAGECEERLRSLAGAGIDVAAAEGSGRLELRPFEKAQVADGYFDPNRMLAGLQAEVTRGLHAQRTTRLWSNMDWVLKGLPGTDRLVECESRFNEISQKSNDVVVCAYDTAKFRADLLLNVLRTHPIAIIGGKLRENPFYVAPVDLLKELPCCSAGHAGAGPAGGNTPGIAIGSAEGLAALGICESLLIALTELGIISEKDARDVLSDVAAAYSEAAWGALEPDSHRAVAEIVEGILAGKKGARH